MYTETEYTITLAGGHNSQLSDDGLALLLTHGLDLPVRVKDVSEVHENG